jgi:histidinol phosphatase-like enzyme
MGVFEACKYFQAMSCKLIVVTNQSGVAREYYTEKDINAVNTAGINNTILVKIGHSIDEVNSKTKFILKSIKDSTQIIT